MTPNFSPWSTRISIALHFYHQQPFPMDSLSLVANVLQVVNFADTVFCAGKSLYDFIGFYKNFSQSLPRPPLELQSLLLIIAYVRVFVTEYANSPFAHSDGHMLPSIGTILTLIEQDFRHLRSLLSNIACSSNDRWISMLVRTLDWGCNEQEIIAARHRLAHYTTNLTAGLAVSGRWVFNLFTNRMSLTVNRRNDVVLRTEVQSLQCQLNIIIDAQARSSLYAPSLMPSESQSVVRIQASPRRTKVAMPNTVSFVSPSNSSPKRRKPSPPTKSKSRMSQTDTKIHRTKRVSYQRHPQPHCFASPWV